jgi:hypothetical protein
VNSLAFLSSIELFNKAKTNLKIFGIQGFLPSESHTCKIEYHSLLASGTIAAKKQMQHLSHEMMLTGRQFLISIHSNSN